MVGKELLWRAWPDGYLAQRGVQTVGGLTCVDILSPVEGLAFLCQAGTFTILDDSAHTKRVLQAGELLPLVDVSDVATWACLLADLAKATQVRWHDGDIRWLRIGVKTWFLDVPPRDHRKPLNSLAAATARDDHATTAALMEDRGTYLYEFHIDTDDPALALVKARIQLREAETEEEKANG